MRILKIVAKGLPLYQNGRLELDFYATDRVSKNEDGLTPDVTRLGNSGAIYSQNATGIVGVNASGKTTTLNLIYFIVSYLTDLSVSRHLAREINRIGRVDERLELSVIFWNDGAFYLLESALQCEKDDLRRSGCVRTDDLVFADETLWKYNSTSLKRDTLNDLAAFKDNAAVLIRRNGDHKLDATVLTDEERAFLGDHESIVFRVTGKRGGTVSRPERVLPRESLPSPVLRAFDPSIESLSYDPELQVYHLTFHGEKERVVGPDAIPSFLSQGTIIGAEMVQFALQRLRDGGYMIIDEIDTSLNRSLVGVVIGLFTSPVTNPRGAQLVFTTHVPEILDELHRKDAVYVLRRDEDYNTEAVKYSDEIKRIENKKSAAILRNAVRGSLPNYPDVQAMRLYVREQLNG